MEKLKIYLNSLGAFLEKLGNYLIKRANFPEIRRSFLVLLGIKLDSWWEFMEKVRRSACGTPIYMYGPSRFGRAG